MTPWSCAFMHYECWDRVAINVEIVAACWVTMKCRLWEGMRLWAFAIVLASDKLIQLAGQEFIIVCHRDAVN